MISSFFLAEVAVLLAGVGELVEVVRPNLLALYEMRLAPSELELLSARYEVARLKIGVFLRDF